MRSVLLILALCIHTACWCRVTADSLAGTYVCKRSVGGGFRGGPNGECMATPPDYQVIHKLTILPDLTVAKTGDTVWYNGGIKLRYMNCDTLYVGKAEMMADTLVITYTLKPVCQGLFYDPAGKSKRYETLKQRIIEKFIILREANVRIEGLRKWGDDEWENYDKEPV